MMFMKIFYFVSVMVAVEFSFLSNQSGQSPEFTGFEGAAIVVVMITIRPPPKIKESKEKGNDKKK